MVVLEMHLTTNPIQINHAACGSIVELAGFLGFGLREFDVPETDMSIFLGEGVYQIAKQAALQ
jgi:hypothetical protein